MRIYRHALESIFAMLELQDLTQILAVSRSWPAAVRSMQSIGATMARDEWQLKRQGKIFRPLPPIDSLVASPLLRHIAAIHLRDKDGLVTPLSSVALALLAQHAPNLTSLWCRLALTPAAPLILPAKLTSLDLTLGDDYAGAAIDGVLLALAAHPSLSRLWLRVFAAEGMDLSLLAPSRTLSDLMLRGDHGSFQHLSDAQVQQLRSSLGHLTRIDLGMGPADLARLLQPPVTARWQDIGAVTADAQAGDLLATLPTLTKLSLAFHSKAPHADFLSQLPLLSVLLMNCNGLVPAASILSSLLPCTGLTELEVYCGFNSAQVCSLLGALTKLRTFSLDGDLESLQCFSSGPATLEELILYRSAPPLPPSRSSCICTRCKVCAVWCFVVSSYRWTMLVCKASLRPRPASRA